ncbi:photosynthetic reaction center cytochrome PufC [Methylobacterium aerolatum]|uniref:Photosynthetic reaction center cytochrome c subunit n=1 Tax=Methylobacterium aerolatum TaxID=418708 RepID=A0ABU0HWN4_9HYPH|nr:photosynthetic reaction center cytochrome PufC [Methylobacterium aerolatum]MDQ0445886.1 photosynthetic reaction center cytochrome c subunit [Methylobacterium aerolatum]GJD35854.1 Photosynthetic reaction center cytochrome c subunit [Methylobacterium aerolatum]
MKIVLSVAGAALALFLTIAMFGGAGWTHPPMANKQTGFRGTGMDLIRTKAGNEELAAANRAPAPADPADASGDKASAVYENVQVLGDLSAEQFNRVMVSITEWVAPQQGCTYCHSTENMASDELYQKRVARRMFQMTQHINSAWKENHVHEAGVTCYTCHRGNPVPANIWFDTPPPSAASKFIPRNNGQNLASANVGLTSLPYAVFDEYYAKKDVPESYVRVNATTALPESKSKPIQDAERTFAIMITMSQALGVNCTFCHNTRSVAQWDTSTPNRVQAWHGVHLVRDLNQDYMYPLTTTFPAARLGPTGDVAKISCATCHNGANKPLNGAKVIEPYPELAKPTTQVSLPTGEAKDPIPGTTTPAVKAPM